MTTTLVEQYTHAVHEFDERLHKVEDDQWSLPTPCEQWDVRALVAHVVDEHRRAPYLLKGGQAQAAESHFSDDPPGSDPKEAWDRASAAALAAFSAPGALESHVSMPTGQINARDYLWRMTVNLAIHAWDLARAIGADERLDPELIRRISVEVGKSLDELAVSGKFARPVLAPAGTDLQAQTLALFGRRSW